MSDPIRVGGPVRCPDCGKSYDMADIHTCSPQRTARQQDREALDRALSQRQYTCPDHRDEIRKGGACCWCQLAALRSRLEAAERERDEAVTALPQAIRNATRAAESRCAEAIKDRAEALAVAHELHGLMILVANGTPAANVRDKMTDARARLAAIRGEQG